MSCVLTDSLSVLSLSRSPHQPPQYTETRVKMEIDD